MISNYNLDCGYHNFELKDKIYLVPDYALKTIYTDGYNEVVFQGNSANVTLLEGHEITFQEEASFDERFKFSKTLSIKVNGYKTFNDLNNRYNAIIETKDSEFYIVNVDFPSFVTHTYTLNNSTNETELVFSSQSNIATLKLTNFEPNNVNSCKEYSTSKIKNVKLTESWASSLSTWQKSLINKGTFSYIEPLQDSISLTEEFDGEKYTVSLGFDIPMRHFKNDWHLKLLQFTENKYRGYISLEDGNKVFVGYNVGLFPSYTINGDIISIRLTETAIRGIAYGNDYAVINSNIPSSIELSGAECKSYNFESSCVWYVESKPEYITISPMSGNADTLYEITICNTDTEAGHTDGELIIKSCDATINTEIIIKNPIYRYIATTATTCAEVTNERWLESGTTCAGVHGTDVYNRIIKEVSYDNGYSWYNTSIDAATTLITEDSYDCGYRERWIESGYTCINNSKYQNNIKQKSYDSGLTWVLKVPLEESASTLIEEHSEDCRDWANEYVSISNSSGSSSSITFSLHDYIHNDLGADDGTYTQGLGYSLDYGQTWQTATGGRLRIAPGETVFIKSWSHIPGSSTWYCSVYGTVEEKYGTEYTVAGNLLSLIYGSDFLSKNGRLESRVSVGGLFGRGLVNAENFYLPSSFGGTLSMMFAGCYNLIKPPHLPATELTSSCYFLMFSNCRSLAKLPELPATALKASCYRSMFRGCTSLVSVPAGYLSATTMTSASTNCCEDMFSGCTSLTTGPDILPATTLAENCYRGMFADCMSLRTAPELPATTARSYCYEGMFSGCTSLTTAPSLPATTLSSGCYRNMFTDCTSLTTGPDILPATTLSNGCYYGMFAGCTSLTTAPELPAYKVNAYGYAYMFSGCTSLTTAPSLPATTLTNNCYDSMFSNCTSLTTAPILSATTLATSAYTSMFAGCTSLTTVPELPATILLNSCYNCMFAGCTSLSSITCLATNISATNCTTNWVNNVAPSGTFVKNPNMSNWTTGNNGIPSGWTVTNYTG